MAMVEIEQAHRIAQEKSAVEAMVKDTRRGHWMGWTISIGAIIASVGTAMIGAHPSVSIALVSLPVVAIVQAFLSRKDKS